MGIAYKAAVMVGLPQGKINVDLLIRLMHDGDIEVCPPYYDGGGDSDAIAGFYYCKTPSFSPTELPLDTQRVEELKEKFFNATGQHGKLYLTTLGY